jgi:NADH:ubiquinone oxidoreductase subunit
MSAPTTVFRRAFSSSQHQPPPQGLLARLVAKAREAFTGQQLVGTDAHGNKYYRWVEATAGAAAPGGAAAAGKRERRRVVVSGGEHLYDPNRLPPEWRAWLQRTRDEPPTEEEAARAEERVRVMRMRILAVEAKERQRRLARELGGGGGGGPVGGAGAGGMAQLLQDMQQRDREDEVAEEQQRQQQQGAGGAGDGQRR